MSDKKTNRQNEIRKHHALLDLKTRHDTLLEFSDSIIGELDADGCFLYVSPSARGIVGQPPEDFLGKNALEAVHPEDCERIKQLMAELFANGPGAQLHTRLRWPQGDGYCLFDFHAACYQRADGAVVMAYHAKDITEQQALIDELHITQQRLERALDTTGLGIWEYNLVTRKLSVDDAFERLLGYAPGEIGSHEDWASRHVHSQDYPESEIIALARKVASEPDGGNLDLQLRLRHNHEGWQWFAVRSAVTARDANGQATHIIGTVKHIHAKVLAEQAAERANRRVALLLESTEEGICGLDQNGAISFLNPAAERLLGASQSSLLGTVFKQRISQQAPGIDAASRIDAVLHSDLPVQRARGAFLRADGSEFPVGYSVSPIVEEDQRRGAVVVFRDNTASRRLADRLEHQALHDGVTGLTNRQGFEEALAQLLEDAKSNNAAHALFYLDLDQFRVINATSGHTAGDELLRQLAIRLDETLVDYHTLARIGGDEFGVLLKNCDLDAAAQVAQRLRQVITGFSFTWESRIFRFGVCIGVVAVDAGSENQAEVLASADAACFAAKEAGRNRVHIAAQSDPVILQRRDEMAWASHTREALDNNRLVLYSQPIVPIAQDNGAQPHAEILLRMLDADNQIVSPAQFLPAAERYFLMPVVDRWVLRHVLEALASDTDSDLCYSVNLSGSTLSEDGLLEEIKSMIADSGVAPERLCFEITETAAIANLTAATNLMQGLRELGCRFALDDFGTGMSSLTYLRQLPLDYVKIDGKFVRGLLEDTVDVAIIQAVYDVTRHLGIRTVAEHVESDEILTRLGEIGVDYAQGFFTGRPAPIAGSASLH